MLQVHLDLLLVAKVRRSEDRIGVIANRVTAQYRAFQTLMRFLDTLQIPVVTTLRDSQHYLRAAEQGLGLHEMKGVQMKDDLMTWEPLVQWLEDRFNDPARETAPRATG